MLFNCIILVTNYQGGNSGMAEGLTIYNKKGNRIDVYKVYSRADVRYMAKFVLTDEEGNKTSRSFPWHEAFSDKGMFLLKRAFEGRGSTEIDVTEIEEMHKKFEERVKNGEFEQQTIRIGQASSIPNNLIKMQLELWYEQATERKEVISLIESAIGEEKTALENVANAQEAVKTAKDEEKSKKIELLKEAEKNLDELKKTYSLNCYVSVEDIEEEKTDTADYSNIPILVREVKGEDQILFILLDSFKKWLEILGVSYSPFKKKLVDNSIMYNPSSTTNPRTHFKSDYPWYYYGICINKLDRMDFMV